LKSITSGGSDTKIVALGIGDRVDESELRDMASSPQDTNVILVQDFTSLPLVEELLRNESCRGNLSLIETVDKSCVSARGRRRAMVSH